MKRFVFKHNASSSLEAFSVELHSQRDVREDQGRLARLHYGRGVKMVIKNPTSAEEIVDPVETKLRLYRKTRSS